MGKQGDEGPRLRGVRWRVHGQILIENSPGANPAGIQRKDTGRGFHDQQVEPGYVLTSSRELQVSAIRSGHPVRDDGIDLVGPSIQINAVVLRGVRNG